MFGTLDLMVHHQCCLNHNILEKKCILFKAKLFRKASPIAYEEFQNKLLENLPTDCPIDSEMAIRLRECLCPQREGFFGTLFQATFKTITYVFNSRFLDFLKEGTGLMITDYNWRFIIKKNCSLSQIGKDLLKAFIPSDRLLSENSVTYKKMKDWHDYYRLKEALEVLSPSIKYKETLETLPSSENSFFPKISDMKTCIEIEAKLNKPKGLFGCTNAGSMFSPLMWYPGPHYERIKELNRWYYSTLSSTFPYETFVLLVKNSLSNTSLEKIESYHVDSIKYASHTLTKYKIIDRAHDPHFLALCQTSKKLEKFLKCIEIYSEFNEDEEYFRLYLSYTPPKKPAPIRPPVSPSESKRKETIVKEGVKTIDESDLDAILSANLEDFIALERTTTIKSLDGFPNISVDDHNRLRKTQKIFHLEKWTPFKDRVEKLCLGLPNDIQRLIKQHLSQIETGKKLLSGKVITKHY